MISFSIEARFFADHAVNMHVPREILEHIILFTDFYTAIETRCDYTALKLYEKQKHTWLAAFKHESLRVLRWMDKQNCDFRFGCLDVNDSLLANLDTSRVDVFQWAEHRYGPETNCEKVAIMMGQRGHLEIVKHLHQQGYPFTKGALIEAARSGHIGVVEFIYENVPDVYSFMAIDRAAESGHLDVVRYLVSVEQDHDPRLQIMSLLSTMRQNHFDVLYFLQTQWDLDLAADEHFLHETITMAAHYGNLPMLQWVLTVKPDVPIPRSSLMSAVRSRNLVVVRAIWQLMSSQGMEPLNAAEAFHAALMIGQDTIIDFFIDQKVPLSPQALCYPAMEGQLVRFQKLHTFYPDVPWGQNLIQCAAQSDQLDMFLYVFSNSPNSPNLNIARLARCGALNILRWLHTYWVVGSHHYNRIAYLAACSGGPYLDLIQWAYKAIPDQYMDTVPVILGGNTTVLRWLLDNDYLDLNASDVHTAFYQVMDMNLLRDLFRRANGRFQKISMDRLLQGSLDAPTLEWLIQGKHCGFNRSAFWNCTTYFRLDLLEVLLKHSQTSVDARSIVVSFKTGNIDMFCSYARHRRLSSEVFSYAHNTLREPVLKNMYHVLKVFVPADRYESFVPLASKHLLI